MKATLIERLIEKFAPTAMLVALGAGCTVGELPSEKRATATLESRSGSTVTGIATFTTTGGKVALTLTVSGASPGTHGVHLHAVPDCSAADATSAMGHWNPDMMNHGLPVASPHHLGDCGNFEVGADGTGTLHITNDWVIGTGAVNDVIGHALIVHASQDDGVTQNPPGNAGARQACGVVVAQ
jgi:Cu-Zn family superoxide dismutase